MTDTTTPPIAGSRASTGSALAGKTFNARDHHGRILRWRIECEPLVSKCGDEFVWAVVVAEYRQGRAVPPRGRKPTPKPWPVIMLPVDVLPNATGSPTGAAKQEDAPHD